MLQHRLLQLTVALYFASGVIGDSSAAALYGPRSGDPGAEPSYGELAQSTYPIFEELVEDLRHFDKTTLPHEAKALRRLIGDVWYRLDIFAYAYPTESDDLLLELLSTMKQGYDRMGDFKDLFDRQLSGAVPEAAKYDESELRSFRDSVLDWKREFLQTGRLQAYRSYLQSPRHEKVFMRPKASLSECYWGGVAAVPSKNRNGFHNLRVLMIALVEKLEREYEQIEDMDSVLGEHNHDVFHDFRVHVRCLLLMARYFPRLTAGVPGASAIEDRLGDMVAGYGELNDIIIAFNAANSKGQSSRAADLRRTISSQWSEIRRWQRKTRTDDLLRDYGSGLRLAVQQEKWAESQPSVSPAEERPREGR